MGKVIATIVRSPWASLACLVVVVFALALPPGGFGVPLCQFKEVTHLPCFACGLTRSFIGIAHLDLGRAALYHPLGMVLFPLFALEAALLPAPRAVRQRLALWAEGHSPLLTWSAVALLAFFLIYGAGRILWLLATSQPSPW